MNEVKQFLQSKLHDLVKEISNVKASVYFESICSAYFIQIQPSELFNDSVQLKRIKRAIVDEFYDNFFDSTLTFIDQESLLSLRNFDYSIQGEFYINELYISLTQSAVNFNNETRTSLTFDSLTDYENNYALAA